MKSHTIIKIVTNTQSCNAYVPLHTLIYRFVAMLIGIPFLLYFQTHEEPGGCKGNCTIACYPIWPDGITNESPTEFV